MTAFPGVIQLSVFHGKAYAIADQLFYNISGRADHDIHRLPSVFIVPCLQCIIHETVIIAFISQHTDPSLCQKGITLFRRFFCDHNNLLICRKMQSRKQPAGPRPNNNNICIPIFHISSPSAVQTAFQS